MNNNKILKTIFLSGCMSYYYNNAFPEKAQDWRNIATARLGDKFNIFNPCMNYYENIDYKPKGVVYQNIAYLNKSDIILLNLNHIEDSAGTLFETFASFLKHKTIVAFNDTPLLDQPHVHEAITMHFRDLNDACGYIENMYCQ